MIVDDEYIQLCIDEMNALAEASQKLIYEGLAEGWYDESRPVEERKAAQDRRRAELYKEHLDAAGIEIRRVVSPRARCYHSCCGDNCMLARGHEGDHEYYS